MIKKLLLVASLLLVGTSAVAQEKDWYTGISFGKINATPKIAVSNISISLADTDASTKSLTIGKYLNKKDIVSFSKTFVNEDANVDIDMISFSYKHLIDIEKQNNFKLFAGTSYTKFDYEGTGFKVGDSKFASDCMSWTTNIITLDFGIQSKEIAKDLNAEFGYSMQLSASGDGTIVYDGTPITLEFDDVSKWYLGLNYKF